jgi:hypothetical protein
MFEAAEQSIYFWEMNETMTEQEWHVQKGKEK